MSDIKQAAKWAEDGHSVRRADATAWPGYFVAMSGTGTMLHVWVGGRHHNLTTEDLLADDWEIAE